MNNRENNLLYQTVPKHIFCKTRSVTYGFFPRLYCSILWSNLKNLFHLIKWQKSINFCYFFCEFLLRFNCLIIPKYWKKMRKNMTWWEISCLNIEKTDLFKSFSEFIHVYKRYGNRLLLTKITFNFLLFILQQQNLPLLEDLECDAKLLNFEDTGLELHHRSPPRPLSKVRRKAVLVCFHLRAKTIKRTINYLFKKQYWYDFLNFAWYIFNIKLLFFFSPVICVIYSK